MPSSLTGSTHINMVQNSNDDEIESGIPPTHNDAGIFRGAGFDWPEYP